VDRHHLRIGGKERLNDGIPFAGYYIESDLSPASQHYLAIQFPANQHADRRRSETMVLGGESDYVGRVG